MGPQETESFSKTKNTINQPQEHPTEWGKTFINYTTN